MTISPGDPGPTDVEGNERALPPYEGRRKSADVESEEEVSKGGANVGGATGPVESAETKAPEPADTERGAVASPSDEQPAAETAESGGAEEEASVGPSHFAGTGRGENKADDQDGQQLDDDSHGG